MIVYLFTLFSEIEGGCHKSGLMVSSEQADVIGVVELVGEEESDYFDAEGAAIDVVAEKEVLLLWGESESIKNI